MKVLISARHGDVPDDAKDYAEAKMAPLGRFNRHARSVDVVLDQDGFSKIVECRAHLDRGAPLIVRSEEPDWRVAVDAAHHRLEGALRRLKERIDDRGRRAARSA